MKEQFSSSFLFAKIIRDIPLSQLVFWSVTAVTVPFQVNVSHFNMDTTNV